MTDKSGESTEVDKMTGIVRDELEFDRLHKPGVDSVCPSVCLSPSISFGYTRPFLPFFSPCYLCPWLNPSISGGVAIRYVLPVYGCRHVCK